LLEASYPGNGSEYVELPGGYFEEYASAALRRLGRRFPVSQSHRRALLESRSAYRAEVNFELVERPTKSLRRLARVLNKCC
jgi:hypothetical protein